MGVAQAGKKFFDGKIDLSDKERDMNISLQLKPDSMVLRMKDASHPEKKFTFTLAPLINSPDYEKSVLGSSSL